VDGQTGQQCVVDAVVREVREDEREDWTGA